MAVNLLELQNRLGKINEEQRSINDKADAATGALSAEDQKIYDSLETEFRSVDSSIKRIQEAEARQRELVATEFASQRETEPKPSTKTDDERRSEAFEAYLRYGFSGLSAEQRNVLTPHIEGRAATPQSGASGGTTGGYLIPQTYSAQLIEQLKAFGGMLKVAQLLSTGDGNVINYPTADDTANMGYIVGENADVTTGSTALTFGSVNISAYNYTSGFILIPHTLIEDSIVDLQGYTARKIAERLQRILNKHATVGTGSGQPQGLVPACSAGVTAAATAITFDNLIDLEHSIDPAYRDSASCGFMFHDQTLKLLRKLKNSDGDYIWKMGDVQKGIPATINGYRYTINQDMDQVAASKSPIVFGDMSAYLIRQVNGSRIRRLDERFAENDQVAYLGFMRFDGKLLNASAVKKINNAAS